jgi:hypothetical protein
MGGLCLSPQDPHPLTCRAPISQPASPPIDDPHQPPFTHLPELPSLGLQSHCLHNRSTACCCGDRYRSWPWQALPLWTTSQPCRSMSRSDRLCACSVTAVSPHPPIVNMRLRKSGGRCAGAQGRWPRWWRHWSEGRWLSPLRLLPSRVAV